MRTESDSLRKSSFNLTAAEVSGHAFATGEGRRSEVSVDALVTSPGRASGHSKPLIYPGQRCVAQASPSFTHVVETQVAVGKNKATQPAKPPQPSTTGRAGCNARFLLRAVHVSGALSGARTGKGPQMSNPRPTPKVGNLGPPWPPGTSGNPAGSPRGRRISDALERRIEAMAPDREFGATARRLECRQRS